MKISRTFNKSPLAMAIGGILASGSPQALAQNDDSAERGLEEIIVTATRRDSSVQDVPYNISAKSGADIAAAQIVDNVDLMREIPGVSVVDRGYRNSGVINGIMIRGINVDGSALGDYALSTVPTVSTYVNDTPIYANFVLKDISRVEVLRGPQATLYGSGSLGGTVRYITNAPDPKAFGGEVSATISQTDGSEGNNYNVDLLLNAPLSDRSAFRISAGTIQNEGIVDYVNVYQLDANGVPLAPNGVLADEAVVISVEDADDVDITYGRAAFYFEASERFDLTLAYQLQSDKIGGRRQETNGNNGFGDPYSEYQNGSIQLEPSSRDVSLASLEMDIDLGFATLTSSTSAYDHEGDSISENTGFYAQLGWLGAYYYNYPRPMAQAVRTYQDEAFVQEFRLVSNGDGPLEYVVGAFYRDQDLNSTQQSFLRGFKAWADTAFGAPPSFVISDMDFDYARDETFKDLGIFGELTYNVSDTFRLTGGLRYFDNEFTNNTYMGVGLWTTFNETDTASFEVKEDDVLFKLNASWDVTDDTMLYGTISEGYRRGGSNAVPTTGFFAEDPGWLQYASDSATNYELGFKGTTERLRYTIAAFYVDWNDVQVNTATSNWAFFAATNGGGAETSGVELELDGYLTDALHYSVGYAFVKAELTDDVLAPTVAATVLALSGATLPGTPENTLNASIDYTAEIGNGMNWINRLSGYYQSSTRNAVNADTNNPGRFNVELGSFGLLNYVSTLAGENWEASLYVRNLTNERGVTGLFTEVYMGTDPAQNYYGNGSKEFLTQPRTVGINLKYRY
jgi:outer membrane receptor protein involved in Fe transport